MDERYEKLIKLLKRKQMLLTPRVEKAFRMAPRGFFTPHRDQAYLDIPLPTTGGQTISQPSVVARMTEWLDPQPGDRVLEIGTGSGWQTAILYWLVQPGGRVYTVERIRELARKAREHLERSGITEGVKVAVGDGSTGLEQFAPYDRIICTAATPGIPQEWEEQLAEGGRIVAPVGKKAAQKMILAEKRKGALETIQREDFYRFVPLKGKRGFAAGDGGDP